VIGPVEIGNMVGEAVGAGMVISHSLPPLWSPNRSFTPHIATSFPCAVSSPIMRHLGPSCGGGGGGGSTAAWRWRWRWGGPRRPVGGAAVSCAFGF
jgi:hypothetical protein